MFQFTKKYKSSFFINHRWFRQPGFFWLKGLEQPTTRCSLSNANGTTIFFVWFSETNSELFDRLVCQFGYATTIKLLDLKNKNISVVGFTIFLYGFFLLYSSWKKKHQNKYVYHFHEIEMKKVGGRKCEYLKKSQKV